MVLSKHFRKDHTTKTAECNYCGRHLSFKSTSANLKEHLRRLHRDAYNMLPLNTNKEVNSNLLRKDISVWKHFHNISTKEMIALCNYCQKQLSYKSTTSNLKDHLIRQHEENCADLLPKDPILLVKDESSDLDSESTQINYKDIRISHNPLWKYFKRNQITKIAECFFCGNCISYKTSTSNLKMHLKGKHNDAYDQLCRQYNKSSSEKELVCSDSEESYRSEKIDDDAEESLRLTEIWNYYEEEGEKARCVVCRAIMSTEYEELKAHLKEYHPKLLLQLMQDKDDSDAGSNNGGEDNTYTEIVYLEQESEDVKPKDKTIYIPKQSPIITRKRIRRCSTPDEPVPLKQMKSDDNDELTIFIKYITCLLKKMSPEAFSQVQVEIINAILKANTNTSTSSAVDSTPRIIINKELPATSVPNIITLNEVQPGSSGELGNTNYTITVATKDGGEIENS